ncbi:MAG: pyridoxal phosphate-dependent aminotransferase [Clostridiaceae bacterium]|nr:pyridoxal phosphate-dependent aminotransferase [Clostridiaceae bacterium]
MIAKRLKSKLQSGSMIRKMFEEGMRLKKLYGDENVFDFSIGNPDLDLPPDVADALVRIASDPTPATHGYMSNSGYLSTRTAVAERLSEQSGRTVAPESVVMTAGAAGALNVVLKTLLDPGDEVILLAPFFVEYLSYVDNHGGQSVVVQTDDAFMPDPEAIRQAITPRTKAIIINTPNNPSGAVYGPAELESLRSVLESADHPIYVISDEPYNEIVYDGVSVPSTLALFTHVIVCYSYSKSLSLAGERIGYIAVKDTADDYRDLMDGLVMANRILGFVNAPSLIQKTIEAAIRLNARVDVENYQARRDALHEILVKAGFDCPKPAGALYLFPRSPLADDRAFVDIAARYNILCAPGSAFGRPGHFRLAFCVGMPVIRGSANAFMALGKEMGLI